MSDPAGCGFPRENLRVRYDVDRFVEDPWHAFSGAQTKILLDGYLQKFPRKSPYLLNAGSSFYSIGAGSWNEISIDIFHTPLRKKNMAACASIDKMPFANESFGAAVCVGEVLAYCDPAKTIKELSRILEHGGQLIIDFGSSTALKYRNTTHYERSADIAVDVYNGSNESIWIYNPSYIETLLTDHGFKIAHRFGTHGISSMARKAGLNPRLAIFLEKRLSFAPFPVRYAEIITYVAFQEKFLK